MISKRSVKTILIMFFAVSVLATALLMGTINIYSLKSSSAQTLEKYETAMNEGYQTEIKSQIETAITVLQAEYDKYKAGEMTEEEAKNEAKEIVRAMRYREDESGYFWIDDTDYILIMHPILTEQEGDNRKELEDQNGIKIIQEILKSVEGDEEGGFNEFYFTKSDGVTVAPKIAYSQIFKPWNWVVSTGNYVDDMHEETAQTGKEIQNSFTTMIQVTIIISVVILLVFAIIGKIFGNWLCNPIIRLANMAKEISVGRIDMDLSRSEGNNEIATLQNCFCDMIDNFRAQAHAMNQLANGDLCTSVDVKSEEDVVGNALTKLVNDNNAVLLDVQNAATKIQMESGQIAAASQSLAQGSTQQASAIQEITASVGDIADKSRANADKVGEVRKIVLEAGDNLSAGNDKMKEMVTAMEEISEASMNIQKVIKAIDDIAFNTNILALNATVEASRAGEHGKGFAVVAEEVRNLAGRSAEAASQTAQMIEDSIHKVQRGAVLAQDTEEALELISESIDKITNLSSEVATASEEQAIAASQIDAALIQTSTVIQTNSATSQQCAAASEQMSNQAERLNAQLSRFQLRL